MAEPESWVDRHGDVWTLGADGLLHTPETRPFPREHVEKKWGPLRPSTAVPAEGVLIPGVTVEVSLHEGKGRGPVVLLAATGDGKAATIHVEGWKIDREALCALLRVVATTIEHDTGSTDG